MVVGTLLNSFSQMQRKVYTAPVSESSLPVPRNTCRLVSGVSSRISL
ncbi:unnamed protein product [Brassica oleracea var. botrytis]